MHLNSALRPLLSRRLWLAVGLIGTSMIQGYAASEAPDAPPRYPDSVHVANGCHISSVAYLARFAAEFPAERGEPIVLVVPTLGGEKRPHTIAVITWQGWWWGRDEYYGVFPLGVRSKSTKTVDRLNRPAAAAYVRFSRQRCQQAAYHRENPEARLLSTIELAHQVSTAAGLLPCQSTTFWITDGDREYPLVFFRPAKDWIAVYDPQHGTCVGECSAKDDAKIVAAIAAKFGYHLENLRADASDTRGALVAANLSHTGGGQ